MFNVLMGALMMTLLLTFIYGALAVFLAAIYGVLAWLL